MVLPGREGCKAGCGGAGCGGSSCGEEVRASRRLSKEWSLRRVVGDREGVDARRGRGGSRSVWGGMLVSRGR